MAHEILYFRPKSRRGAKRNTIIVWENLILVRARSPQHAYRSALRLGRLNEQQVTINGKEGECRFLGLRELTEIHDSLTHGSELEWRILKATPANLRQLVTPKGKLQAFASASRRRAGDSGFR